MPIPDYQTLMLPLLKIAADGLEHRFRDIIDELADQYKLSADERAEMLPSGTAALFDNRVGWARTYLKQAGLLESTKRGVFRIAPDGVALLKDAPSRIDVALLHRYPKFREFQSRRRDTEQEAWKAQASPKIDVEENVSETPEDLLASAYTRLRKNLEADLLEQVKTSPPSFFEQLVVDLLVKMGYGGNRQDAARAIGRSGDGGIDGIIDEDRLGLDVIYIQAKRWDSTVGSPEIQKFAGALQGKRAKKGIFITTSNFSKQAQDYTAVIDSRIILIDGIRLASLMVDHNVGVTPVGLYELKKIDTDYFEGE